MKVARSELREERPDLLGCQVIDWPRSRGDGVWMSSNGHHRSGWPAAHPWKETQVWPPVGGVGSACAVQPFTWSEVLGTVFCSPA